MALLKCHECGGPLSSSANRCPACGALRKGRWSGALIIVGIMAALVIFGAIVGPR